MEKQERKKRIDFLKILPDILTVSRLPIGIVIGFMGPAYGQDGLQIVFWLLLGGWTTDIFDGKIAQIVAKSKTWIGENEIVFDSLMLAGLIVYLGYSGFMPLWSAIGYTLLLLYVIRPGVAYKTRLIVESPVAVLSFIALNYLTHNPSIWKTSTVWCLLNFLHDIERTLILGKIWREEILKNWYLTLKKQAFRTHLDWISLVGSIILIILALIFVKRLPRIAFHFILGLSIAAFSRALYVLWIGKGKS